MMSTQSLSVSMIREPRRAGEGRCAKGRCQLLIGEHWSEVLQVSAGIVTTPFFWVDVPMACECVGLGTKFPGAETDYHVEL